MIESKQMFLPNLSPEMYYGNSALGSSKLKAFATSALAFKKYEFSEDTAALAFGRAAHSYILEPECFYDLYAILPEDVKKPTNPAKPSKKFKLWQAENPGRIALSQKNFDKIVAMNDSLVCNKDAKPFLDAQGLIETSLFWEHEAYPENPDYPFKIHCKGRLDKLLDDGETIVDYKTCASVERKAIYQQIKKFKYWLQEAHYTNGLKKIFPDRNPRMVFIFQEKTSPYDVCVIRIADFDFIDAKDYYDQLMERLALCYINNDFPGQHDGILEWSFGN